MKRRHFIGQVAAAGALSQFPLLISCESKGGSALKVLVLGGTNFVGPAIVNQAITQGHNVTLFNRGQTNPDLFPSLPLVKGDREVGTMAYSELLNQKWDVVIDVWPEKSKLVDEATSTLVENTGHYVFISSIAVYQNYQTVGLNENSPTLPLPENRDEWYYGEEKVMAENLVRERFPQNHTIIRAGAIAGWRDPAVGLLYWALRLKYEPSVLAPGSGEDPIQFIDVKDVGKLVVVAAEQKMSGTFNCLGPEDKTLTWRNFLQITKTHLKSEAEIVWADEEFLRANKVYSFSDLPLWAPLSEDEGFMQISNQKLVETGFKFRPFTDTVTDALNWYKETGSKTINFGSEELGQGLTRERELALINTLKS